MNTTAPKKPLFPCVKDGDTFQIAGMEFIKFPSVNGQTPAVMKDIAFCSRFGDNNDLRRSDVLQKMETEILPKIIEAVFENAGFGAERQDADLPVQKRSQLLRISYLYCPRRRCDPEVKESKQAKCSAEIHSDGKSGGQWRPPDGTISNLLQILEESHISWKLL